VLDGGLKNALTGQRLDAPVVAIAPLTLELVYLDNGTTGVGELRALRQVDIDVLCRERTARIQDAVQRVADRPGSLVPIAELVSFAAGSRCH